MEEGLLKGYKEAAEAAGSPKAGEGPSTDPLVLERLLRLGDELRAVQVAREAKIQQADPREASASTVGDEAPPPAGDPLGSGGASS
jgi:hypothetical protein